LLAIIKRMITPHPPSPNAIEGSRKQAQNNTASSSPSAGLDFLQEKCPESTAEERERFLMAKKGNPKQACKLLTKYLKWHYSNTEEKGKNNSSETQRQESSSTGTTESTASATEDDKGDQHDVSSSSNEIEDREAGSKSKEKAQGGEDDSNDIEVIQAQKEDKEGNIIDVTKLVYMPDDASAKTRAKNGSRVFHIIPAVLDLPKNSAKEHANMVARYIDSRLSRTSMEKVAVVIDVRTGTRNCPNPSPMKCIPFAKRCATWLPELFPGRLSLCVVLPVPGMFQFFWNTIQPILEDEVAEKFQLLSGDDTQNDDFPPTEIHNYFDESAVATMEEYRRQTMKTFD
jgi:hypothetical protein